ncbi:ATPase with chaperone activity [Ideonella sp. YS5]|uniref:ATPase with chaperone activity n=1 Tax=Ideonella sp. YS5 TaxID=3453714 RepID=UPI003EEB357F
MTDNRPSWVPDSFLALFVEPGRSKPNASTDVIQQRYAFCEDLATLLTDTARSRLWELRITEADVLDRIHAGLTAGQIDITTEEALWVRHRLAELLGWRE